MKIRQILLVLLAAVAIGVLAFLLFKTQSVDTNLHQLRLANIRAVDNLDVDYNRNVMQVRTTSLGDTTDDRGELTRRIGDALNEIDQGPAALHGLDPELDQALATFLDTIQDKFELSFDFEARGTLLTQRLINSLDSIPVHADATLAAVSGSAEVRERLGDLLRQIKAEAITFALTPTPVNQPVLAERLTELDGIAEQQSSAFREAAQRLRAGVDEVLGDKTELMNKLNNFLGRPTGPQLQAVEQAYLNWHERQVAVANQYRLWLVAYAAILLLGLGWLGIRLSRSYRELDQANAGLQHANETLEAQVATRTQDLSQALDHLRASQAQLIQSEKMASLGQMVAGVAHEINTPLGYARSNAEIVRSSLADFRALCDAQTRALTLMVGDSASDEEVAQALSQAQALGESLNAEELGADLDNLLADTDHGLQQISELVGGLKDFSRVDRSRTDLFNVNDGLDSALKICNNQLKHGIEVVRSYGQLPQIECSPSQLNQVFLNLLTNAAQAIDSSGKIFVHTAPENDGVAIRIMDTGSGMPEDVRERIFEPFFTTKPVGKGTGLGLSIVFRIIEDHGGRIQVRSALGKGSEFVIHLPLKQQGSSNVAPATEPPPPEAAVAAA
jgi:two-component system NtrC family sensor kinase